MTLHQDGRDQPPDLRLALLLSGETILHCSRNVLADPALPDRLAASLAEQSGRLASITRVLEVQRAGLILVQGAVAAAVLAGSQSLPPGGWIGVAVTALAMCLGRLCWPALRRVLLARFLRRLIAAAQPAAR